MKIVQVIGTILKKNANRFLLRFTNEERIGVSAADVDETADVTQDFAKGVGTLPGNGPCADAA